MKPPPARGKTPAKTLADRPLTAERAHRLAIAIDGHAASGKSAVGQELARRRGVRFLDTGAMYRAVSLAALQRGVDPDDPDYADALSALAASVDMSLQPDCGFGYRTLLEGEDITDMLRLPNVEAAVAAVAAVPGVRRALVARQRAIAERTDIIMAGRDIGTEVLPNAPVKIFLTASPETRAMRRHAETMQTERPEHGPDYERTLRELRSRDGIDSSRAASPLRPAEDAVVIETDDIGLDEVVAKALALIDAAAQDRARADAPSRAAKS